MPLLIDYRPQTPKPHPWHDTLARRLVPRTKRLRTLALSLDGRIAVATDIRSSVLNPCLALQSAPPLQAVAASKRFSPDLLDRGLRTARTIKAPLVGHELVFWRGHDPAEARKDTALGRGDIVSMAWSSMGWLFVVDGCGACFALRPSIRAMKGGGDGTWGGLLGLWQCKPVGIPWSTSVTVMQADPEPLLHDVLLRETSSEKPMSEVATPEDILEDNMPEITTSRMVSPEVSTSRLGSPEVNTRGLGTPQIDTPEKPIHVVDAPEKVKPVEGTLGSHKKLNDQLGGVEPAENAGMRTRRTSKRRATQRAEEKIMNDFDSDDGNSVIADADFDADDHKQENSDSDFESQKEKKMQASLTTRMRKEGHVNATVIKKKSRKKNAGRGKRNKKKADKDMAVKETPIVETDEESIVVEKKIEGGDFCVKVQHPGSDVLCVCHVRIFKRCTNLQNEGYVNSFSDHGKVLDFVAYGGKSGISLHAVDSWDTVQDIDKPSLIVANRWCSVLSCLGGIKSPNGPLTVLAAGGAFGDLAVYGVSYAIAEDGELGLCVNTLWQADPILLAGPLSAVSWSTGTLRDAEVTLSVGFGNGFMLVDWYAGANGEMNLARWACPHLHRVQEAHLEHVTAVQVCMDGSAVTSGMDGHIRRWVFGEWREGEGAEVECLVIQDAVMKKEPVMCLRTTMNGVGIFSLATSLRGGMEVCDVEDASQRKHSASARRSMLSLFVMPKGIISVADVERAIMKRLEGLMDFCGMKKTVCMWDVELFLEDYVREDNGLLMGLKNQFLRMVKLHKAKGNISKDKYYQRARGMLWLSRLILRGGSSDIGQLDNIEGMRSELRNSLLWAHYDDCVRVVLETGLDVEKMNSLERKSLEAMCQFVSICKTRFTVDVEEVMQRVVQMRDALHVCLSRGENMMTMCPVCENDSCVPLVADGDELGRFYCFSGDVFPRCVLTGLPCTDVVPLVCHGCEAKAMKEGGGCEESFKWIDGADVCPFCNGVLLSSSVEAI